MSKYYIGEMCYDDICRVADNLSDADFLSFRRTNHGMRQFLTNPSSCRRSRFYALVRRPSNVYLTCGFLRDAIESINRADDHVVRALRNIVIVGVAYHGIVRTGTNATGAGDDDWAEELELLTRFFSVLALRGMPGADKKWWGAMQSLELRVVVELPVGHPQVPGDGWVCDQRSARVTPLLETNPHLAPNCTASNEDRWEDPMSKWALQCTIYTFLTTMRALGETRLPIRRLAIFDHADMDQCNLPRRQLSRINWEDEGLVEALRPMFVLSLSISTPAHLYSPTFRHWEPTCRNGHRVPDRCMRSMDHRQRPILRTDPYVHRHLSPANGVWSVPDLGGFDMSSEWDNVCITESNMQRLAESATEFSGLGRMIAQCKSLQRLDLLYLNGCGWRDAGSQRVLKQIQRGLEGRVPGGLAAHEPLPGRPAGYYQRRCRLVQVSEYVHHKRLPRQHFDARLPWRPQRDDPTGYRLPRQ